jgi:hypothetical protein
MLIMWGALTFAGYLVTWLSPRNAFYAWATAYVVGVAGSIAISASNRLRTGIRTFDYRMLAAFLLFVAFGMFCSWLGHFGPRKLGAFWPIYFMVVYTIAGLWIGRAFVAIGLGIIALTLVGYFLHRRLVRSVDGLRQWRRAHSGRPLDAPELTDGRTRRHHPSAAAAENHGGIERAAGGRGARILPAEKADRATDGNLGAHIETLAKAGYVAVEKAFVGKKPQTTVTATAAGRGAFARHVATLQEIIAASARQTYSGTVTSISRKRRGERLPAHRRRRCRNTCRKC